MKKYKVIFEKIYFRIYIYLYTNIWGWFKMERDMKSYAFNWRSYLYLKSKYNKFMYKLPEYKESSENSHKIWWCWLQGEENAPLLHRAGLKSIRENIKDREVVVITNENFRDYVDFPEHIIKKYEKGLITRTHFSDLLRLELLINYGGTWIDSSVYVTGYNEVFFRDSLFVFDNIKRGNNGSNLSSWFITANKNDPILMTTRDLLYNFWKHHNKMPNYFLFHLFFTLASERYHEHREKVPTYSNLPPHMLQRELPNTFSEDRFEQIKQMSTIHKLNRRVKDKGLQKNSFYEYIEKTFDNH